MRSLLSFFFVGAIYCCASNINASSGDWFRFPTIVYGNEEGVIGKEYQGDIDSETEFHYIYKYKVVKTKALRLKTEVLTANVDPGHPLRVTVRYDRGSKSWQVPFKQDKIRVEQIEQTLCLVDEIYEGETDIQVVISTAALNKMKFSIKMEEIEFRKAVGSPNKVDNVQLGSPVYYFIDISKFNGFVQVKVESEENVCAIVSVQPWKCPIALTEDTISSSGSWQTMLKLAAFIIKAEEYPEGFFLALITLSDESRCGNETIATRNRVKSFNFEVTNHVTSKEVIEEIVLSFVLILGTALGMFLIAFCYSHKRRNSFKVTPEDETDVQRGSNEQPRPRVKKGPKYVQDLTTIEENVDQSQKSMIKVMFQQSDLYIWLVLMMGIFYGIPAIQLVLKYQDALDFTGNNDLCYFNFLCSIPTGGVTDFNHILSNIGYMAFGLSFLGIVWYRKRLNDKKVEIELESVQGNLPLARGVPQHFGIYYALGFALISEGILSACYHVCPTNENFQFDTTFMYVIAVLLFIKIYQFRHPDASSNAYKAFFGIAMVIFLEVLGIFFKNNIFWAISLFLYFIAMLVLSSVIYQAGKWSLSHITLVKLIKNFFGKAKNCDFTTQQTKKRVIFIFILDSINMAFIIFGAVTQPNISTYLLMVFIGNLMVYFLYYVAMKKIKKEKISPVVYVLSAFAIACWIPAMYFFLDASKSTNLSPAESRNLNRACLIGDLYDTHDIWHFFSAMGLFLNFVILLVLDDGVAQVPRNKLHIF